MEITTIHNKFYSVLRGYIAKRVNNKTDVEDLLQEIFIKIHIKLGDLNDKENIKSWLFTVTRNAIIDYYRGHRGRNSIVSIDEISGLGSDDKEFDHTKELEQCIHRFIEQLPGEYRNIILDSEIKGIKQKDLVEKYQLAYPSVRSRIQRGRSKLRDMFLDCCSIELDRRGNVMNTVPKSNKC